MAARARGSMTTVISITAQHLDGNDPHGLNVHVWLDRLTEAYRATALAYYPDATVDIAIDRHRHSCGATRQVSIDLTVDGEDEMDSELAEAIEAVCNRLWDQSAGMADLWGGATAGI